MTHYSFTYAASRLVAKLHKTRTRNDRPAKDRYQLDPLSHPAIRAMNSRELADLPFPTYRVAEDRCRTQKDVLG